MRDFSHWSLRYARDRLALLRYTLSHRDAPWFCPDAVNFLAQWLRTDYVGFEWGAGRSTVWFSRRVARLVSVEHDPRWHARVQSDLVKAKIDNVELLHLSETEVYVQSIERYPAHFHFVVVDGVSALRDRCACAALRRLQPGGALIVDDVHRYLPSNSRAPRALPRDAAPLTPTWAALARELDTWPAFRFSSGVTDTAIWLKPMDRA